MKRLRRHFNHVAAARLELLRKTVRVRQTALSTQSAPAVLAFPMTQHAAGPRRIFARDTLADLCVLRDTFIAEDYNLTRLARGADLQALYRDWTAAGRTPLIIDAGANIGASAVWFADLFPAARISCFEPDQGNMALVRRNTQGLNVELHEAALGSRDGACRFVDPGLGAWGFRVDASAGGETAMIGASGHVREKMAEGLMPFIAKIDIEGGEADLFSGDPSWAAEFPLVIAELHDWLMPGQAVSRNFLRFAADHDRDLVHIRENIFSIRNGSVTPAVHAVTS
jgi:FkbM family methyltransferase